MDQRQAIARRVVDLESGKKTGPWTLEIYPTLRCNLDCVFCDTTDRHRPPQKELSPARWLSLLDEAADLGAASLMILGGGEPLIAPATLPLMERAKQRGLHGFLTTNGTRFSKESLERIVRIHWDEVHFSIDGADATTHDALRGQPGAFQKAISNACRLRRMGGRVAFHTVITRANFRQLTSILHLATAVGAFRVDFDALVAYRPEQKKLALEEQEIEELSLLSAQALEEARKLGIATTLSHFLHKTSLQRGYVLPASGPRPGIAGAPCLKAWHHLVIQADGRISPCCVLSGEGESLAEGSLAELWENSPYLRHIRNSMRQKSPTGRCKECSENILSHERAIREWL